MTRNEKIAEKCGWEIEPISWHTSNERYLLLGGYRCKFSDIGADTPAGHWLMHLIVQKLMEEGWSVFISIFCNTATMSLTNSANLIAGKIHTAAEKENHPRGYPVYVSVHADTAPAAVFELACKIWGIEGE